MEESYDLKEATRKTIVQNLPTSAFCPTRGLDLYLSSRFLGYLDSSGTRLMYVHHLVDHPLTTTSALYTPNSLVIPVKSAYDILKSRAHPLSTIPFFLLQILLAAPLLPLPPPANQLRLKSSTEKKFTNSVTYSQSQKDARIIRHGREHQEQRIHIQKSG